MWDLATIERINVQGKVAQPAPSANDEGIVSDLIRYENGDMEQDEIIVMYQKLVDSGLCWKLQGFYGREAADLIASGVVTQPNCIDKLRAKEYG